MNLNTKIAGIEFKSCTFNASGPEASTFEELEKIGQSDSAAIMTKSCTLKKRKGNPLPRIFKLPLGYFNSEGLPNPGYKTYLKFIPKLRRYDKPIIVSVAGFSVEEYKILVKTFQKTEVDLIEVNLSCPNIKNQAEPIAYNPKKIEEVLKKISYLGGKPIGLKLPPYPYYSIQQKIADLVKKYSISFLSCTNTLGNALIIDAVKEKPVLKGTQGFGGLSGQYLKPIALGNVRRFYEILKGKISIIGVGGIRTGQDAFEFLLAGADAVQIGTIFIEEGVSCFRRINRELKSILEERGYSSFSRAKGKLKNL